MPSKSRNRPAQYRRLIEVNDTPIGSARFRGMLSNLPDRLRALAARLGCGEGEPPREARLRQSGQIRRSEASAWMGFRAEQTIALTECAFVWSASTGPLGAVHVTDTFREGHGALSVKLFGALTIASMLTSPLLDRGELLRYLAELPWAPDAMLFNRHLSWTSDGAERLIVAAGPPTNRAELVLTLGEDGMIASAYARDRPRAVGAAFELTEWRGVFSNYLRQSAHSNSS